MGCDAERLVNYGGRILSSCSTILVGRSVGYYIGCVMALIWGRFVGGELARYECAMVTGRAISQKLAGPVKHELRLAVRKGIG